MSFSIFFFGLCVFFHPNFEVDRIGNLWSSELNARPSERSRRIYLEVFHDSRQLDSEFIDLLLDVYLMGDAPCI
jgi:hypothetical protein